MNRRLEEELLQTAFGEASPEEMAELERRVVTDPEAAKALKTYQFMKEGLKDLGDIPAHQLSTERLRHAILEQGLKPKKESTPWFGWLGIAAPAAAALAIGFVLMNRQNGTTPMIVSKPDLSASSGRAENSERVTLNVDKSPKPEETVAAKTDAGEAAVPAVEDARPFVRTKSRAVVWSPPPRRGGVVREDPELQVRVSPVAYGPPVPEMTEPSLEDVSATADRGGRRRDEEIIVIQPERDAVTGANKATEVGSASNVAIGG